MRNGKDSGVESGVHNQISKGTIITGDITTDGVIRIDGTLRGTLISQSKVVVGPSGIVEGDIACKSANISGELKANIKVEELLTLQASAKVNGEIQTGKLSIEPGAEFSGQCKMGGIVKELHQKDGQKQAKEKTA